MALSQSLSIQPNQPNVLNLLANALSDIGEFDQAVVCFNHAIQMQPSEAGLMYNLGNCWLRKATRIFPGAELAGVKSEELRNAVACFQKVLDLSPKYTDAGNNLGNALRELGRMDEAIAAWRRTTTVGPHHFAYYNLGRALYERDLIDDALDAIRTEFASIRIIPMRITIWEICCGKAGRSRKRSGNSNGHCRSISDMPWRKATGFTLSIMSSD